VIVPIGLLVLLAIVQISRMVTHVASWVARTNLSDLGDNSLQVVNKLLARLPFLHITVTAESLRKAMVSVTQKAGEWFLHFLQNTAGSLFGAVSSAIIFSYVFVALLTNREKLLTLIRQLNPLGEDVADLYLRKVTSPAAGSRRLLLTRLAHEGPVQPVGCCARHVRQLGRDARIAGIRMPLG
jgi:predicted PurR-regulated permease PerM